MGENGPRTGLAEPQGADEPALDGTALAGCPAGLRLARPGQQALLVYVQRRLVVRQQDAVVLPLPQQPGGLVVAVAAGARAGPGEDEPDHVVRIGRQQLAFGVVGDHVVRWRGDLCEAAHPVAGVTESAERGQRQAGGGLPGGRKDLHI